MRRFALALLVLFLATPIWAADVDQELSQAAELVEAAEVTQNQVPDCDAPAQSVSDAEATTSWLEEPANETSSPSKVELGVPRGCSVVWCNNFCDGYCIIFGGICNCA